MGMCGNKIKKKTQTTSTDLKNLSMISKFCDLLEKSISTIIKYKKIMNRLKKKCNKPEDLNKLIFFTNELCSLKVKYRLPNNSLRKIINKCEKIGSKKSNLLIYIFVEYLE